MDQAHVQTHVCRLCCQLTPLTVPIFEGEGLEQGLPDKLKHLPVTVAPGDLLPRQVCYQCASTLIAWDALCAASVETERKLRVCVGLEVMDSDDEPLVNKLKLVETKKDSPAPSAKSRRKKCTPKKWKKRGEEEPPVKAEEPTQTEQTYADSGTLLTLIKTEMCEASDDDNRDVLCDLKEEVPEPEEDKRSCDICDRTYKSRKYLLQHMKNMHETPREMQKCELCDNSYKTRANLEKHYVKEHVSDQAQCQVCHASVHVRRLERHLKVVHGVKKRDKEGADRYKCKYCDKWFKNKYVRNSHVRETHMTQTIKCKLCDFEGVRQVVRRHRRDVHAEKRFPCGLCENAFKTLHTLKMHMTAHSDLRCYTCDICGMGFKRLNNVRDHMKCHEEKSNQCQICGNFFARKRYLAIHEKTIHNFYADGVVPEEKGFECGTCGAKLKWKKNLLAHMRIHTGEKPYVCKICKKDFICHGSLRTHMAKHGVCALSDKAEGALSPGEEGIHEAPSHLQLEMSVFNHFAHPIVAFADK